MSTDTGEYAANAIEWARARLGDTDYATRCLAFVEDAIERSNGIEVFGGDYAAESARLYGSAENSGMPPLGALVFYDGVGDIMGTRRNWGHVGLSLGDGLVIHAWDRVRIDDHRAIEALTPAPGWEPLAAAGWTPLSRVLENSTPKSYGAEDPADVAAQMQIARFTRD
jgi:cell wall-associated NlpC family hydrolase